MSDWSMLAHPTVKASASATSPCKAPGHGACEVWLSGEALSGSARQCLSATVRCWLIRQTMVNSVNAASAVMTLLIPQQGGHTQLCSTLCACSSCAPVHGDAAEVTSGVPFELLQGVTSSLLQQHTICLSPRFTGCWNSNVHTRRSQIGAVAHHIRIDIRAPPLERSTDCTAVPHALESGRLEVCRCTGPPTCSPM